MNAPRLNIPLELETPIREPDGMGGFRTRWTALGRVWAEMRAGTGAERAGGIAPQSVVNWQITLRAAPVADPRRPRPDQRLSMGAGASRRHFRIEAVAEAGPGQRFLICRATEETGA